MIRQNINDTCPNNNCKQYCCQDYTYNNHKLTSECIEIYDEKLDSYNYKYNICYTNTNTYTTIK